MYYIAEDFNAVYYHGIVKRLALTQYNILVAQIK